ncbi:MAG: hypothetical protein ABJH45_03280, partial [Paracoccaceae bacterium]
AVWRTKWAWSDVGPFDGFHAVPAAISETCLVRFDNNRYSVNARAVGPQKTALLSVEAGMPNQESFHWKWTRGR